MSTVTKVHYVRAADPIGRLLIEQAADCWSGDDVPDWRDNEYVRGQIGLLGNVVRVIPEPADENWTDLEDQHDRMLRLVRAAGNGGLDDALRQEGLLS
jgi:hypothetical protein